MSEVRKPQDKKGPHKKKESILDLGEIITIFSITKPLIWVRGLFTNEIVTSLAIKAIRLVLEFIPFHVIYPISKYIPLQPPTLRREWELSLTEEERQAEFSRVTTLFLISYWTELQSILKVGLSAHIVYYWSRKQLGKFW